MLNILRQLHLSGMNSKSTALYPFLWALSATGVLTVVLAIWTENRLLTLIFSGAFIILLLCTIGIGIYFAIKRPDCLRSEKFTIDKMMIERGQSGDTSKGLHAAEQHTIEHNERI